ncbi:MAG: bifunctional YncE family protein/alkaline phosphatase family protein [Acidobacteria bacterium]|nr:bifunctional YncE family protein/alkaline phosphatase family protein [Acidobacteriota bacterium]
MRLAVALLVLAAAALLVSQPEPAERVGPLPGGGFLLNSGWRLEPAGKQVALDTFPISTAISPDGRYLLALNAGYNPPSISVLEVPGARETGRTPAPDGWLGLAFSPKGDRVYVGGGSQAAVFEFTFAAGKLQPARTFPVVPAEKRTHRDFIGDLALSPDGRLLYAADLYRDSVVVINPQSGVVTERVKTGRRPYRILFHPGGKSFFVTSWADGSLGHYDAATGALLETMRLGPHPAGMVLRGGRTEAEEGAPGWAARLFVAAANTNSVYTIGVGEDRSLQLLETINVSMTPRQPLGMTPSALALSADGSRLYVVCSDANAVAVADVSGSRSRVLGFVPTGWYPTAARSLADGRLVVLNGKGLRSFPNPGGPNPARRAAPLHLGVRSDQYVASIQTGTASFIDPIPDSRLAAYSKTVLANSPYRDRLLDDAGTGAGSPIPSRPGGTSPIEHVIYIVKENRTYDQVLGGMREGNGDPSLVLFGERVTPNHHKLAREFVLLDNFYVNSDVSADGHNWSTAAIAPDYVQKLWPNSYAGRRKLYDYEGGEPAATPPAGYLWTSAAAAGVSLRNYGYFVNNLPQPTANGVQVAGVRDPVLSPVTSLRYRGFDMDYPDVERARVFLEELAGFEKSGHMPRLLLVRLGNDHTSGATPGKIAPLSAVADNDYAFGMIVEGVSRSRFWPKTAIFVLEDDAQNGPDHVDSHRSPAYVISPYAKRGAVDSSMYNTTSMLRTMELILGLRPMTHFDAGARPMHAAFQTAPDTRPYIAEKPRISLVERNPAAGLTAARSARLDFSQEDRIDDDELNAILWLAIRGPAEPAPAPVASFFGR